MYKEEIDKIAYDLVTEVLLQKGCSWQIHPIRCGECGRFLRMDSTRTYFRL